MLYWRPQKEGGGKNESVWYVKLICHRFQLLQNDIADDLLQIKNTAYINIYSRQNIPCYHLYLLGGIDLSLKLQS
ncbi:hypothetical protein LDFHOB_10770 [Candidatus Electronema aureum]